MKTLLVMAALAASCVFGAPPDVAGEWELGITSLGDTQYGHLRLKSDGDKLTGNLQELTLEGKRQGDAVEFAAKRPNGDAFGTFTGKLTDAGMSGDAVLFGKDHCTWTAKRMTARPGAPRTVEFGPKEFHRVFSDAIPPVARLFPGDTVRTWTVDAGGTDAKGVRRSQGGNPETGPFYIEGAFPGDTLVIKLNRVRLNRDTAGSGDQLVPTTVSPGYVSRTKYDEKFNSDWKLDREAMIGRPAQPTERLKNYTVKLQPMMGCLAVAPPGHQAIRTGGLGPWGGNMDYNQMREGTTVYLPVFAPGALFFLGDGHAAQGDGELTGDALETSMDVEFTVDLIKGYATGGPRAENAEYLMSMGIAGSTNEAIQNATAQLANWIQKEYRLNPNEVAIVLGTAIQYNVAELVDPLYHVVAKVPKSALAGLKQ